VGVETKSRSLGSRLRDFVVFAQHGHFRIINKSAGFAGLWLPVNRNGKSPEGTAGLPGLRLAKNVLD
jgi:hypothetical protein